MIKNIIKPLLFVFAIGLMASCSEDDPVVTDTDGNIVDNIDFATLSLDLEVVEVTDDTVTFTITSDESGEVFYIVQPASMAAPDSRTVVDDGTSVPIAAGETKTITVSELPTLTDFVIYTAATNNLNERTPDVFTTEASTTDTADPIFLPANSTPAQGSEDNDPFETNVTLAFSEPVFYEGGTISFTGFFTGNTYEVDSEDLIEDGSSTVLVNIPTEFFAQDDAIVVNFEEGTFVDNAGKPVAALTGTNYFFFTGAYTLEQTVTNFFGGTYSMTAVNNIGVSILPDGTTFDIDIDENEDGNYEFELLNAVDAAVSNDFNNFNIVFGDDASDGALDGIGPLFMVDLPVESVYTAASGTIQLYWSPFFNSQPSQAQIGQYNLSTGEITANVGLTTVEGPTGSFFGNIEYTWTPVEEED